MDGIPDARGFLGPSEDVSGEIYTIPAEGLESHEGTIPDIPIVPGSVVIYVLCCVEGCPLVYYDDGNGGLRTQGVTPVRFGTVNYETGAWQLRTSPSVFPQGKHFCAEWKAVRPVNQYPSSAAWREMGHYRQTSTWFFAFIDNNGNTKWDDPEPAGLAQLQPHDLSYGQMPSIEFGLTDYLTGYRRFNWTNVLGNSCTVVITRASTPGAPRVIVRTNLTHREWFHEGDYQYAGQFGLDPGASYLE